MDKSKKIIAFFIIYALIISLIYYFKIGGDRFLIFVDILTLTPLIGVFLGYKAIRYFGFKTKQGKSAFFITAGLFSWFLADILWMIFFNGEVISIADIFYLLGYPLLCTGIFLGVLTTDPDFLKNIKKISILILLQAGLTLLFFKILPISWSSEVSFLENLVTSGYLIVDLLLLIAISSLLFSLLSGKFRLPWIMIAIGTLINFLGDIYYAINYNTYNTGDLIEVTWLFAYLFYALGLYFLKDTAAKALKSFKETLGAKK